MEYIVYFIVIPFHCTVHLNNYRNDRFRAVSAGNPLSNYAGGPRDGGRSLSCHSAAQWSAGICWRAAAGAQLTFCLPGARVILLPSQNALGDASEYIRKCSSTVLSAGAFTFKRNSRTVLSGRCRDALSPKSRSASSASIDCKIEWNQRHEVERREILSFIHSVSPIRKSLSREQFFEAPSSPPFCARGSGSGFNVSLRSLQNCEPFHASRLQYTRITCTPLLDSLRPALEFRPTCGLPASLLKSAA